MGWYSINNLNGVYFALLPETHIQCLILKPGPPSAPSGRDIYRTNSLTVWDATGFRRLLFAVAWSPWLLMLSNYSVHYFLFSCVTQTVLVHFLAVLLNQMKLFALKTLILCSSKWSKLYRLKWNTEFSCIAWTRFLLPLHKNSSQSPHDNIHNKIAFSSLDWKFFVSY